MVDLSIVIVNWNTRELLRACLASIFRHPPRSSFEVIVVDNASGDRSAEMARGEFPGVRLKENAANLGFAAASNIGSRMAAGRFLLFLNPDTEVHAATLSGALSFMEQHPGTGVLGCRTLNPDGSLQSSAFAFPTCPRIFAHVSGLSRLGKLPRRREHSRFSHPDYVQGSFFFVSKVIFERSGGFNEAFFLYGEEVDLCQRLRRDGLRIDYDPGLTITHHGGASTRNSALHLGYFVASCLILFQAHRSEAHVRRLLRTVKAALAIRICHELVLVPLNFKKRGKNIRTLAGLMAAVAHGDPLPSRK
jgi:GT2 family glycosyltransferase